MVTEIQFEEKSRGQSEIRLQHETGETTILTFLSTLPLQAKEYYLAVIYAILKKYPDILHEDQFSIFTLEFARNNLEMPFGVGVRTNDDRIRIGKRIKELREERGWDAKVLSKISGIDAANICRIEQGRYSVGLDVLTKLANSLGYQVELVKM